VLLWLPVSGYGVAGAGAVSSSIVNKRSTLVDGRLLTPIFAIGFVGHPEQARQHRLTIDLRAHRKTEKQGAIAAPSQNEDKVMACIQDFTASRIIPKAILVKTFPLQTYKL